MKKSNFVALVLGTVSGVMFALGMCMALLPEWNAFKEGVVFGIVGIVLDLGVAYKNDESGQSAEKYRVDEYLNNSEKSLLCG